MTKFARFVLWRIEIATHRGQRRPFLRSSRGKRSRGTPYTPFQESWKSTVHFRKAKGFSPKPRCTTVTGEVGSGTGLTKVAMAIMDLAAIMAMEGMAAIVVDMAVTTTKTVLYVYYIC